MHIPSPLTSALLSTLVLLATAAEDAPRASSHIPAPPVKPRVEWTNAHDKGATPPCAASTKASTLSCLDALVKEKWIGLDREPRRCPNGATVRVLHAQGNGNIKECRTNPVLAARAQLQRELDAHPELTSFEERGNDWCRVLVEYNCVLPPGGTKRSEAGRRLVRVMRA